jgi:hypothetical protein
MFAGKIAEPFDLQVLPPGFTAVSDASSIMAGCVAHDVEIA